MGILALFMCVIPMVTSITVSSNGNSPDIKMIGGMMVDMQQRMMSPEPRLLTAESRRKIIIEKNVKLKSNSTLTVNERYRRLIPYMTFYYANDLISKKPDIPHANVEVEKVEIVEHSTQQPLRHPKIVYNNIPRYQGNRLTHYNIASANPPKYYYKAAPPTFQHVGKYSPNHSQHNVYQDYERPLYKPHKVLGSPFVPSQVRKPYHENYQHDELNNIQYYIGEKPHAPKYKLVPYEQTPPVNVFLHQNDNYDPPKRLPVQVPIHVPKENVVMKPRPFPAQYYYETVTNAPQTSLKKQPVVVSESYFDNRSPHPAITRPVIEGGFKPIINAPIYTTESVLYSTPAKPDYTEDEKYETVQVLDTPVAPGLLTGDDRDVYQTRYLPHSNRVSLTDLINVLQFNRTIPKTITKENVGSSIRTLLHVLNVLKAYPEQQNVEMPILSTPQPFVSPKVVVEVTPEPIVVTTPSVVEDDIHSEPHLAHVTTPSQHLDDYPSKPFGAGSSSQRFPLPVTSDAEGGTPGHPGVDYPTMTTIPPTSFNCKTQRYKGFFADPETRCQVWHYCDLNGGQASFLCPNGTIFSQAALTCDWWFNVKCDSTTQLYVLNESLYKFILPHSPKFPEDYSGPLVDKYLTLKFKEMEEQFKKNKNKQAAEKSDSDEAATETSTETEADTEDSTSKLETNTVSEASVIVQSPGNSGTVQRLQDE